MGVGTILIVITIIVIFAAIGVAVYWFIFKPPSDIPSVCKNSVFYKNAPVFSKNVVAKACALQQPPLPEKTLGSSILAPIGFSSQWELNAIPIEAPAWRKTTYYASKYVNKKDGRYGKRSYWSGVHSSLTKTLPSMSWNAGVYSDAITWGLNVYRSFSSDGKGGRLVGKAIYNPFNSTYGYIDYVLP